MTGKLAAFAVMALFIFSACVEKPVPGPDDDPPVIDNPTEPEEPQEPEEPEGPADKDVTLMGEFSEEFSGTDSGYFDFAYRDEGDDFRYFSGFPSLSENGNTILMLRLDPADGAGNGASISARDYTYYGSYSIRMRIPDIVSVQSKLGVCVDFELFDDDPVYGRDRITLGLRLADRGGVYVSLYHLDADGGNPVSIDEAIVPGLSDFNAAAKNYIYGFDWSEDVIAWWVKAKPSADKTILKEIRENVPPQPLRLRLRYYHSANSPTRDNASVTQAPNYPYELETDWIKYTPSQQ